MGGIYIKGMEMPTGCGKCPCSVYGACDAVSPRKTLDKKHRWSSTERMPWCPLVEVPAHGRLIDGDELSDGCDEPYWCRWKSEIDEAPTIIPADEEEEENG